MKYAVIALTVGGCVLAEKIAGRVDCDIFCFQGRCRRAQLSGEHGKIQEFSSLTDLYPRIMPHYRVLIMIMSLGIVTRTIYPFLQGKERDPAVLVMDEKGEFVISLLSGHLGGANAACRELARRLGATPVITTSSDVQGLTAVDAAAGRLGWALEPVSGIKRVNSALVNGQRVRLLTDAPYLAGQKLGGMEVESIAAKGYAGKETAVLISSRIREDDGQDLLYLRPRNLYLGIGCKKGVSAAVLKAAVEQTFRDNRLSFRSVAGVASCTVKAEEPGLKEMADDMNLPLTFFTPHRLSKLVEKYSLRGSVFVRSQIGVEAVCEPAAMAQAAVPRLAVAKTTYPGITVAVAEDTSTSLV